MNFHETKSGRIFFEHQLPALITALKDIAMTMQRKQQKVQIPVDVPPNFLKDLHNGFYETESEKDMVKIKEYLQAVTKCQKNLKAQVSPQLWSNIETYKKALDDMYMFEAEQEFISGFHCAMKMVITGLTDK